MQKITPKNQIPAIGIISLGCAKALVDSERIITLLKNRGYQIVADYKIADLVIINTCGFINAAVQESLNAIAEAIAANGNVIVTGCLGATKEKILAHFNNVLAITGPHNPELVLKNVLKFLPAPFGVKQAENFLTLKPSSAKLTPPHYAYIKIAEGCNHRCSYCLIPKLRGQLISRPIPEIVKEAEFLVGRGTKELILIAQDSSAYGADLKDGTDIVKLIKALAPLKVWLRLHYLYPHPKIDNLVKLMTEGKLLPYLDVPLQHANAALLKTMHRPAWQENILERIKTWRQICPAITIRSTFIVGLPGEDEKTFQELINFLKKAKLDRVGAFTFSAMPETEAYTMAHQIPEKTKKARLKELMLTQEKISAQKLQAQIGKKMVALVDAVKNSTAFARSQGDSPNIDGKVIITLPKNHSIKVGDYVNVTITAANQHDLIASAQA